MAKAINWPSEFREEILAEDTERLRCALRLGTLYYENQYWVPGERVDLRVNHRKVRKVLVQGELKSCRVGDLTPEDFAALKSSLQSVEAVAGYLGRTYGQPVNADTPVTVVYYRNEPLVPEEIEQADDPHM